MLALTKELLEAILDSIDEAIHAVDQDGMTMYYNCAAAKQDGIEVREALGKHVLDTFPSLTKDTSTLLNVLETKRRISNLVQRYQNRKGEEIYAVNTTIPILLNGEVAGAVEISKNYSAIQKLTNIIVDLQSQMKQSSSKGRMMEAVTFQHIITADELFMNTKRLAQKVARTDATVLVYGETGTGKELFVRAIHEASDRANKPFIAQNCAALPESLLESLLFGTAKGSYTGAIDRAGLFELADGGTLFLDEINSMPLDLQAKLLRVLEDGIVRRIGDHKTKQVHVRVITAMNEQPEVCVAEQKLRTDLYYRLHVFSLFIPPLRDRRQDILILARHFLSYYNRKFSKYVKQLDAAVEHMLTAYSWPGNVRELKHVIEHAMVMVEGETVQLQDLPHTVQQPFSASIKPLREVLQETEQQLIEQAIAQTEGNVKSAAQLLGIPRQTLQYKLQKYRETAE